MTYRKRTKQSQKPRRLQTYKPYTMIPLAPKPPNRFPKGKRQDGNTMKATLITTATGEQFVTESGKGRCWHSEEVADVEIDVAENTVCGICERPINQARPQCKSTG